MKKTVFVICLILQFQFIHGQIVSSVVLECECNIQNQSKSSLEKFYFDFNLLLRYDELLVLEFNRDKDVRIVKYCNIDSLHIYYLNSYFKSINFDCYLEKYKKGEHDEFHIFYNEEKFKEKCVNLSDKHELNKSERKEHRQD